MTVKLKRLPEDFQVAELTEREPDGGPFALYLLKKRSIGTLEAIEIWQRRWNLQRNRISWGGLKDRHAVTEQLVTVRDGPRRDLREAGFEATWLGRCERPFTPADIAGNRFRIVMRDLSTEEAAAAETAMTDVASTGLPNYFDDQRFGSVGESGKFIGRSWCLGNYEQALWLALADAHPDDPASEREQKRILRELWGKWAECKARLERSHRRSVVTYLADKPADRPGDFRGAFARIKVDLRGLYLSAFQSAVWNRMLALQLRRTCEASRLVDVPLQLGPAPFPRGLPDDAARSLRETRLPLPSARLHLEPGPTLDLVAEALRPEGMELREMRVKYPRDSFFSRGERSATIVPAGASTEIEPDELYAGRMKLTLAFDLPRGSYATILVKRLTETW